MTTVYPRLDVYCMCLSVFLCWRLCLSVCVRLPVSGTVPPDRGLCSGRLSERVCVGICVCAGVCVCLCLFGWQLVVPPRLTAASALAGSRSGRPTRRLVAGWKWTACRGSRTTSTSGSTTCTWRTRYRTGVGPGHAGHKACSKMQGVLRALWWGSCSAAFCRVVWPYMHRPYH